jgi:glyoxylase-like metal-dependent hydrolase (beta-lactamase superfamily II)
MSDAVDDEEEPAATGGVDPESLADEIRRGEAVTILDVRDRDEFEAWHVDGPTVDATQVPYNRLVAARAKGGLDELVVERFGYRPPGRITVVCAKGHSSAEVAAGLRESGFDAANLDGGMTGWAGVYTPVPVRAYDGPGRLLQYHRPATGCLAHLLVHDGEAAVFDPLRHFADRYVEDVSNVGARLSHAVDTHVHADHVSGIRDVAERTDATPLLPAGARDRGLAFDAETVEPGAIPDGEEAFTVGDASVRALSVPGHTPEMTAFSVGSVLLSGDSLFLGSVARPDLEDPDLARERAGTLYDSIRALLEGLPADTVVAPGHTAPTDPASGGAFVAELGSLRRDRDLLDLDRETFLDRVAGDLPPRPANHERIVETNLGRETLADDAARAIELGPNNCAATVE